MKQHQTKSDSGPGAKYPFLIEAEVIPGLEAIARQEIATKLQKFVHFVPDPEQKNGSVCFRYRGDPAHLKRLNVAHAVYVLLKFDVPRPKALLGNENFRVVMDTIKTIQALETKTTFNTIHIDAAGSDSSIMQRLLNSLADATNLIPSANEGDLLLRIRRGGKNIGWEVLVRIGNRPLATREWRVCNYEAALNATVAHAIAILSQPTPLDRVLNLGSGSGSILIERAAWGRSQQLVGVEQDIYALRCCQRNMAAAHQQATLLQSDIKKLPFAEEAFDIVLSDLPFGQRSGSHTENEELYPAALIEAARVTSKNARMILLTHEIRLMQACLADNRTWKLDNEIRITLRGLHPRIYVLAKT